jgi:DNA-binding response OmpR family regulator
VSGSAAVYSQRHATSTAFVTTDSPRRRVLFIEDEPGLQQAYARYFRDSYEMAFAASGEAGTRAAGTFHPDVLVLDLRLPDTDGVDLLRTLRQGHPVLPVVITTSYASLEPVLEVLGLRHSGYLVKPFELDDLRALIDATA